MSGSCLFQDPGIAKAVLVDARYRDLLKLTVSQGRGNG